MADQWIVIPRWDDFQHADATKRGRDPIWIKTYTRLLADEDYLGLSGHRRAVLHAIWLDYARSGRRLPDDTATLSRRFALRVTSSDLEALNHAGFLEICPDIVTTPVQTPSILEKKRKELRPSTPTEPPRASAPRRYPCNQPECQGFLKFNTPAELADHLEHVHWIEPAKDAT